MRLAAQTKVECNRWQEKAFAALAFKMFATACYGLAGCAQHQHGCFVGASVLFTMHSGRCDAERESRFTA